MSTQDKRASRTRPLTVTRSLSHFSPGLPVSLSGEESLGLEGPACHVEPGLSAFCRQVGHWRKGGLSVRLPSMERMTRCPVTGVQSRGSEPAWHLLPPLRAFLYLSLLSRAYNCDWQGKKKNSSISFQARHLKNMYVYYF